MRQGFFEDESQQKLEQVKQGSAAMLVIVRARPLTIKQMATHPVQCLRVLDNHLLAMMQTPDENNDRRRNRETQFAFDHVFDKHASTKEIYDECLTSFLEGVLDGFNSTILAYGATGCGKTYTYMIGDSSQQGLCPLFLIDLLGRAHQHKVTHHVVLRLSYIEIYNEVIKDLLISEDRNLELREDPKEGVYAQGATEIQVSSLVELATLLKVGAANRSKEATSSNEASSRSHALLLVKAQTRDKASGIKEEVSIGKLSLVDLAGSERAAGGKGTRQMEGGKINKSLLTLGNCIQILAEGAKGHVPYRQSKLTRLLKQALGGNCRTAMVSCVSPFAGTREQTYNTLLYASRARNIGSSITRNVLSTEAHLSNYVALIGNLKRENQQLKKQLRSNKHNSLPQLMVGLPSHLEVDRLSGRIDSHFAKEVSLVRATHEISLKLDKVAFRLLRLQLQQKKSKESKGTKIIRSPRLERDEQSIRSSIEEYGQQKQALEQKLEDVILRRGSLVEEIKNGDWGSEEAKGLFTHYRQKKIEVQLEEVRLRELRITTERGLKDDLFQLLGEEIKSRDRIIEEQRLIIQKNNILNRITYSRLNQSQTIPKIENRLNIATKPGIFRQLSEDYGQLISAKRDKIVHDLSEGKKGMEDKRQARSKKKALNLEHNNSDLFLDRKEPKPKHSARRKSKRKENNLSPGPRHKPSQFDHIYLQR